MSNRKSEARKAVNEAWKNEKALVEQGKGTRDWTPEQQISILTRGKAYDENGKAYQGHHRKSVEAYPEYQGKWEVVQLLSFDEHFDAHAKNYRNKTNGTYDYKTGKTQDFGNNSYSKLQAINLSNKASKAEIEAAKNKATIENANNKSKTAQKFNSIENKNSYTKDSGKNTASKFNSNYGKTNSGISHSSSGIKSSSGHSSSVSSGNGHDSGGKGGPGHGR